MVLNYPTDEEIEVQQLLATKDTNGKVNHVIVKEEEDGDPNAGAKTDQEQVAPVWKKKSVLTTRYFTYFIA